MSSSEIRKLINLVESVNNQPFNGPAVKRDCNSLDDPDDDEREGLSWDVVKKIYMSVHGITPKQMDRYMDLVMAPEWGYDIDFVYNSRFTNQELKKIARGKIQNIPNELIEKFPQEMSFDDFWDTIDSGGSGDLDLDI